MIAARTATSGFVPYASASRRSSTATSQCAPCHRFARRKLSSTVSSRVPSGPSPSAPRNQASEVGVHEDRPSRLAAAPSRGAQPCASELALGQGGTTEVGASQIGIIERYSAEIEAGEVRRRDIHLVEVEFAGSRFDFVRLQDRQLASEGFRQGTDEDAVTRPPVGKRQNAHEERKDLRAVRVALARLSRRSTGKEGRLDRGGRGQS